MMGRKLLCLLGALLLSAGCEAGSVSAVEGRLVWPSEVTRAAKIKLSLNVEKGRKIHGWPKADGSFSLLNVPEGTWLLDVIAPGLVYPQYRLDVRAGYPTGALVSIAHDPEKLLPPPMVLKPMAIAEYFEKREPLSLMSMIKTPYGLMVVFGIFAIVVLPRMKIDPEEMKEAKATLTGGGSSSSSEQAADKPVRLRN